MSNKVKSFFLIFISLNYCLLYATKLPHTGEKYSNIKGKDLYKFYFLEPELIKKENLKQTIKKVIHKKRRKLRVNKSTLLMLYYTKELKKDQLLAFVVKKSGSSVYSPKTVLKEENVMTIINKLKEKEVQEEKKRLDQITKEKMAEKERKLALENSIKDLIRSKEFNKLDLNTMSNNIYRNTSNNKYINTEELEDNIAKRIKNNKHLYIHISQTEIQNLKLARKTLSIHNQEEWKIKSLLNKSSKAIKLEKLPNKSFFINCKKRERVYFSQKIKEAKSFELTFSSTLIKSKSLYSGIKYLFKSNKGKNFLELLLPIQSATTEMSLSETRFYDRKKSKKSLFHSRSFKISKNIRNEFKMIFENKVFTLYRNKNLVFSKTVEHFSGLSNIIIRVQSLDAELHQLKLNII